MSWKKGPIFFFFLHEYEFHGHCMQITSLNKYINFNLNAFKLIEITEIILNIYNY